MAWGPRTLLEHMTALLAPLASSVHVLGPGGVPDRHPGRGPVEGVASAIAATRTDQNIIVALDLPFLEPAFLGLLLGRAQAAPLVVCRVSGRIPLCLSVTRGALPVLDHYLRSGKRSVRGLAGLVETDVISEEELEAVGFSDTMFTNINTPEDYARHAPH